MITIDGVEMDDGVDEPAMSNNGQVKEVELVTQYPSESGHWYSPETGLQVELPPRTWAKTAIKRGLVPGVTSIIRVAAKSGGLELYEGDRFIECTYDELKDFIEACGELPPWYEEIRQDVWNRVNKKKSDIFGRGKELHAAIEKYIHGDNNLGQWHGHVVAVVEALRTHGISLTQGSSEHSFAVPHYRGKSDLWTNGYGGKVDWHNDTWLLDWKTKDRLTDDSGKLKKLAYPEHAQQLAAYEQGLWSNRPTEVLPERHVLRCANVFVGVDDAAVHVHEWTDDQLFQGWRKFECLLAYWWEDKQP